jgi:hypothetical protein
VGGWEKDRGKESTCASEVIKEAGEQPRVRPSG